MAKKNKDRIKLFICITFIAALLFVAGRYGMLEQDRITLKQMVIGCSIACIYMVVSVYTYSKLGADDELY